MISQPEPKAGDLVQRHRGTTKKIIDFDEGQGTFLGNGDWVDISDYHWDGARWMELPTSHAKVGCANAWEEYGGDRWCADCGRPMDPADEAPEAELSARGRLLLLVADKMTSDGQSPRDAVDQALAQHYRATAGALSKMAMRMAKAGRSATEVAEELERMSEGIKS